MCLHAGAGGCSRACRPPRILSSIDPVAQKVLVYAPAPPPPDNRARACCAGPGPSSAMRPSPGLPARRRRTSATGVCECVCARARECVNYSACVCCQWQTHTHALRASARAKCGLLPCVHGCVRNYRTAPALAIAAGSAESSGSYTQTQSGARRPVYTTCVCVGLAVSADRLIQRWAGMALVSSLPGER